MDVLISNGAVRRGAQAAFLAVAGLIALICLLFDVLVLEAKFVDVMPSIGLAVGLLKVLTVPFSTTFAPIAVLASALPTLVSSVCFAPGPDGKPSATMNGVGVAAVYVLAFGLLSGVIALVLLVFLMPTITALMTRDTPQGAVHASMTALASFQVMYLVQLLGLRAK